MIEIRDQTNTLSPQARAELGAVATKHRVVANFVFVPTKGTLSQQMASCVSTPNTICIGVDAQHRFTATEFGYDTGIRKDDFAQVARAGNADFHAGNWADGVKSIVSRAEVMSVARSAAGDARPVIVQSQVVRHETVYWPFLLGFGVLAAIVTVFIVAWRKARQRVDRTLANYQTETAEMASRNLREQEREDFDRRLRESSLLTGSPHVKIGGEDRVSTPVVTPAVEKSAPSKVDTTSVHPEHWKDAPRWSPADDVQTRDRMRRRARSSRTPVPAPVVVVERDSGAGDFVAGMMVGDALASRRRDPTPAPEPRRRHRTPTPEPERASSFSRSSYDDSPSSGGDSSSTDSSSSGGDSSSFDSSSSGGSSSDF